MGLGADRKIAFGLGGKMYVITLLVESAYSFIKIFIQKGFLRGRIS